MTCCRIGHERMRNCGDWSVKCIIYVSLHQIEEHQYGVVGYRKGNMKICIHIIVIYANCGSNHISNSTCYISRHKAN